MFKIINKTDAVITETLTALIYGEPGIGKTSISFTTDNPILLDFDGGIQRACYRQTAIRVEKWEDVIEFQESSELKKFAPKTIIIDTVGTMLDNYLASYVKTVDPKNMRRGGELSLQGYGAMKDAFFQFKNWAKSQRCNIVFIAHVTTMEEGDNTKFIPKVTGGSYDILRQECDLIGYMYSNKNRRVIDFNPADSHIGKNCAEFQLLEIPSYTENGKFTSYFQNLINATLEKMNSLSEVQTEAVKKMESFKEGLEMITDLDTVELCFDNIQQEKERALQLQQFNLLKAKADSLGIKYNSKEKKFVQN
jgi:hypothetical protein